MIITPKILSGLQKLSGKFNFKALPDYASFIAEKYLKEFTMHIHKYAEELDVPMLKFPGSFTYEEQIKMSMQANFGMLQFLSKNKTYEFVDTSVRSWLLNQSTIMSSEHVEFRDLTTLAFIRRKAFRQFLSAYTSDTNIHIDILNEVDEFTSEIESFCIKMLVEIQQELYNEAQTLSGIGNWAWNLQNNQLSWSREVYRIYELDPTTSIKYGDGVLEHLHHPDDVEMIRNEMKRTLETLKPHDFFYRIQLNSGVEKILNAKGQVQVDDKGVPIRVFGTLQDVTLQKKNEHQLLRINAELQNQEKIRKTAEEKLKEYARNLRSANDNLTRSNQELQQFAYAASHDLQEPLRKIIIFSGKLQQEYKDLLPDMGKEYINKMVSSSQRMTRLIDDLLNFSRVSRSEDKFEKVNLNEILQHVLNDFEVLIAQKNAIITYDSLPVLPAIPLQMTQLFHNIISNALKFSRESVSPMITISLQKDVSNDIGSFSNLNQTLSYYKLVFKDNGIGFNQSYSEQIFTIFQRLHGKSEYSGTGIGLALCRKIMDNHNGAIYARSEESKGTEFHLILPVMQIGSGVVQSS